MKKITLVVASLALANIAGAVQNVPGYQLTGFWRMANNADRFAPTIGVAPLVSSHTNNDAFAVGPWIDIGIESWHTKYSDGGMIFERSYDYTTVNPGFTANGGGSYVNEYTIAIDYRQTSGLASYNSLFQTADTGRGNDGDLFTDGAGHIGIGAVGYSTMTYDASTYHRIVWSINNGNFFRVYVDGTLFLDGAGQPVDGRFSLYPDHFHLCADDSWEDQWGYIATVMTWNRALSGDEIAGMGGWSGGASPTPLIIPEPGTFSLAVLGGLILLLRRGRR